MSILTITNKNNNYLIKKIAYLIFPIFFIGNFFAANLVKIGFVETFLLAGAVIAGFLIFRNVKISLYFTLVFFFIYGGLFEFQLLKSGKYVNVIDEALSLVLLLLLIKKIINKQFDFYVINKWVYAYIIISILSCIINGVNILILGHHLLNWIRPIIIFFLIMSADFDEADCRQFFKIFILICGLEYLFSLFLYGERILDGQFIIDDLFRGTFGANSAYYFAFVLNMGAIYLISSLIIIKGNKLPKVLLILVFLSAMIICGAGATVVYFSVSLIFFVAMVIMTKNDYVYLSQKIVIAVIILIITIFPSIYMLKNYVVSIAAYKNFEQYGILDNSKVRIMIAVLYQQWENASTVIFGVGGGNGISSLAVKYHQNLNYDNLYSTYNITEKSGMSTYYPNNDFMSLLSETGILGFLTCYLIYISLFKYFYKKYKISFDKNDKLYLLSSLGVLIFVLLYSTHIYIFQTITVNTAIWMFFGFTYKYSNLIRRNNYNHKSIQRS